MYRIRQCDTNDYPALVGIWERSVRASHDFLGEDDICEIRAALIPSYFPNVALYGFVENGVIAGFIGLSGNMIEMLFVDDHSRGKGVGSALINHAISLGADSVDVNEQNPLALDFYKSKGFRSVGRDELDSAGRPFPILHLAL
ncbi:MAG: GNAT family N-acetyltransferase [Muribaculaceae bacterium]|nr:GNAT family N-acetyltransferase [Muribaculaceae bacterium]